MAFLEEEENNSKENVQIKEEEKKFDNWIKERMFDEIEY
jgi:hypothetical protein